MNTNAHASIQKYVLAACAFLLFVLAIPFTARAEYIESFVADIDIKKDSSFTVVETIQYVFTSDKHGMYRCIPILHPDPSSSKFKDRFIEIAAVDVKLDGGEVPTSIRKTQNETCIQIGDTEKTVSGPHTYTVAYTVYGGVSYMDYGGADLYWNAVGDAWEVPIKGAEVRVSSSDGVLRSERSCYFGIEGKTLSCEMRTEAGTVYFAGRNLNPGDGLTISQALNRTVLAYDIREKYNFIFLSTIGLLGLMCILAYVGYRHHTKYKTDEVIITQFEPYPDVMPMESGVLFDGKLNHRDVSAGFLYLAREGYIHIRNTHKKIFLTFEQDDFEITLKKIPPKEEFFASELLTLLFGEHLTEGKVVSLSDLKNDTQMLRKNAVLLAKMEDAVIQSLTQKGFYTSADIISFLKQPVVLLLTCMGLVLVYLAHISAIVFAVGILVLFIILSRPRRSALGYEAVTYLKGFKDFLRVTESQRYIFHNAPSKNAEHFMEYLPYAIAFGVELEWMTTFKDITLPKPEWYEDTNTSGNFSAFSFTKSVLTFSHALKDTTKAPSTTSSSSGGGRVGGGAGGGGGGSW